MILTVQSDIIRFIIFADDTNLLNYNNSVKRMNKQVNQDLKNLTNWLKSNKIFLNVSKTEVALFKSSRKLTDAPLKLKHNGKRFYPTKSVKYLGINIDENLNWKQQISDTAIKLNKANGMNSELWTLNSEYIMQYLNPIYITPYLFGHKIQIQLKDSLFCKRNPYGLFIS